MLHLDTHAVIWLYEKKTDKFSARSLELIEKEELRISPMVILETRYLQEIGRITIKDVGAIFSYLKDRIGLRFNPAPFEEAVLHALDEAWTRDPFDRIITAQARAAEALLLTRDSLIQQHYERAFWE